MPDPQTSGTLVRIATLEKENNQLRERIDKLEEILNGKIDKLETTATENKVGIARLSERLATYQLLQSAYATAAAVIATVLGRTLP